MVQFKFSKQFLQSIDRAFQKYFWGKSTSSKDINYKKNIKKTIIGCISQSPDRQELSKNEAHFSQNA